MCDLQELAVEGRWELHAAGVEVLDERPEGRKREMLHPHGRGISE